MTKRLIVLGISLLTILLCIPSVSGDIQTVYVTYIGEVQNITGEIWCTKQEVFKLSTGEGIVEYDRGKDRCIATLILDAHREPHEITSVDVAIRALEDDYKNTIETLEYDVRMGSFWLWFILIFGGALNFMFVSIVAGIIYIYPNLRFR